MTLQIKDEIERSHTKLRDIPKGQVYKKDQNENDYYMKADGSHVVHLNTGNLLVTENGGMKVYPVKLEAREVH